MIPTVAERPSELEQLCVHYRVQRLDLFGSAITGNYGKGESDLDFLVEFQTLTSVFLQRAFERRLPKICS